MWIEGMWLTPNKAPIITLPRMTATFHGMSELDVELRILGDHDDPFALLKAVLDDLDIPPNRVLPSPTGRAPIP